MSKYFSDIPVYAAGKYIAISFLEGSGFQHGKYRIYSYFLQGHTAKEKADFLKDEYGTGGHSPILAGTGIREDHGAKGLKLSRGYADDAPELLLTWGNGGGSDGEQAAWSL